MEHLPPVLEPYQPLYVPYIADHDYDADQFSTYPHRQGWDIESLQAGNFQGRSPAEVASFLQAWLYFGMMSEVTKLEIDSDAFVRVDDVGKKWLTTEKLPELLQNFRKKVEEDRAKEDKVEIFEQRNARIYDCFKLSRSVWQAITALQNNPLPDEIAFAIHILAITLQVGCTEICGLGRGAVYPTDVTMQPGYRVVPWETDMHWRIIPNPFAENRMIQQGWCPSIVEQVRVSFNILGQYYVSLLGPPKRKMDHTGCAKGERDCQAFKNVTGKQNTHLRDGCSCQSIYVNSQSLEAIIAQKDIPVLCFDAESKTLEVIAIGSRPGLEYTAISHVWTDGWGNAENNSLSLCRVEKLVGWIARTYDVPDFRVMKSEGQFQTLHEFHSQTTTGRWQRTSESCMQTNEGTWKPPLSRGYVGKLYFWMDTLCVPRYPDHIYKRAIMQMRQVYSEAERVLVLDAELLASSALAKYEEIEMRIETSRWVRRLWTVQEGALARRLFFQFADQAVITSTGTILWISRQNDLAKNFYNSIGWDCHMAFESYQTMTDKSALVQYIWMKLLHNRSVTVPADEPICAAILLNFDMEYLILADNHDERMRRYWEMHENHVPVALLFLPGSRLKTRGFKWAPDSVLPCSFAGGDLYNLGTITSCEPGIDDTMPAKCLSFSIPAVRTFLVDMPQVPVGFGFPCTLDGRKYYIHMPPKSDVAHFAALEQPGNHQLAVIIERESIQDSDGTWQISGSRAAMVSVLGKQDVSWTAEFPYTETQLKDMSRDPVTAVWVQNEIKWRLI
ncbi:hypothetical protein BP5796_02608 [Coleophoma crateriformis]|uniref:Heterokaryon incompatibility domain-containing protein n=1 Tax=Coleophoma crateriformis TaxID=565419 RepID=A0A3D8SYP2_9HELO|nr:hypothetical protein BP5796_02608 [Coleophoma crateriformis]